MRSMGSLESLWKEIKDETRFFEIIILQDKIIYSIPICLKQKYVQVSKPKTTMLRSQYAAAKVGSGSVYFW